MCSDEYLCVGWVFGIKFFHLGTKVDTEIKFYYYQRKLDKNYYVSSLKSLVRIKINMISSLIIAVRFKDEIFIAFFP